MADRVEHIDAFAAHQISDGFQRVLRPLSERLGLTLMYKGGTYTKDGTNFTMKFEVSVQGEDGIPTDRQATDFQRYAFRYGMRPEDLGREFTFQDHRWRIVGARPHSKTYPVVIERSDLPAGSEPKRARIHQTTASRAILAERINA